MVSFPWQVPGLPRHAARGLPRRGDARARRRRAAIGVTLLAAACMAHAQPAADSLEALQAQGARDGWTFSVGATPVSNIPLDQLCGLSVPDRWWVDAPFDPCMTRDTLPDTFDWRDFGDLPPVRDQGACGSCWAFATVGPLECNISLRDGDLVDLSEQWLVSCNRNGYGCGGGWWAHEYHLNQTDACGGTGAVREADFPYTAQNSACNCPYDHPYTIDGWSYVGTSNGVPTAAAIKQAIYDHGPISVAVCVTSAFASYTGGVFNACAGGTVNHGVVLVGWDDNQGDNGVWILRNSWGPHWGEDGHMRIAVGCSSIGYAASYVEYAGINGPRIEVTPGVLDFGSVATGDEVTLTLTVKNVGGEALTGSAGDIAPPFELVGPTSYTLDPAESTTISVRFAPTLQGTFDDVLPFSGGGGTTVALTGAASGAGPGNTCADAPHIADGTFTGSNVHASTEVSSSCGGGGTADVWWLYTAPRTGVAVIDTCGSSFDTVLSAYDACGGNELLCNDDHGGCGSGSRIELGVTAGDQFLIRVAGCALQTGDITLNTATTTPPRTISGRIVTNDGAPLAGVTLAGLPGEPATDDNGEYTASVDYGFSGTVAPFKTAYTFYPQSRSYDAVTGNQAAQDYTAVPPSFIVSGQILNQFGNPVSGVSLVGFPGTPTSGADGRYEALVPLGFSGTVQPSKGSCTMTPAVRTYADVSADLLNEDYEGSVQTGALQVVLSPASANSAGARWRLNDGPWHESGHTVTDVPVDRHSVTYAAIDTWSAPQSEQVLILADRTTRLERTYAQRRYRLDLATQPGSGGEIVARPAPDDDGRYLQDTVVELTAVPAQGFRVLAWSGTDTTPAAGALTNRVTMTGDSLVIAEFTVKPFRMLHLTGQVVGAGGWLSPTSGTYAEGSVIELTATPEDYYELAAWEGTDNDASRALTNRVTLNETTTVRVRFRPINDCDGDDVPDEITVRDGADCNDNGVPDTCESDVDADGLIDDCDNVDDRQISGPSDAAPAPTGVGLCGVGMVEAVAVTLLGLGFLRRRGEAPSSPRV